jgi:hypothetical protein
MASKTATTTTPENKSSSDIRIGKSKTVLNLG